MGPKDLGIISGEINRYSGCYISVTKHDLAYCPQQWFLIDVHVVCGVYQLD